MKVLGFGSGVETAPGVYATEQDLTLSPEAGASTEGAIAGVFAWGPVNNPKLVSSEDELFAVFGKPATFNAETWFSAANFLGYADKLWVNRVANTSGECFSAVVNTASMNTSLSALHTVENRDVYESKSESFTAAVDYIAKFPGAAGNSLKMSICPSANAYESTANLASATYGANVSFVVGSSNATIQMAANTTKTAVEALVVPGDLIFAGNTTVGTQELKVVSVTPTAGTNCVVVLDRPYRLSENFSATTLTRRWEFASTVSGAPKASWYNAASGNTTAVDTLHVVIVDEDGFFTQRPGTVLEVFEGLSRATDAINPDGDSIFFKTYLNRMSDFVWTGNTPSTLTTGLALNIASLSSGVINKSFANGADGGDESTIALAAVLKGYDVFAHKDAYDVAAIISGKPRGGTSGEQSFNYIIDNVAEIRKDVVAYGSVAKAAVVNNRGGELNAAVAFRGNVRSSSYAVLDSGYKYQYDKYNDVFRWIPMNGDIAGISSRTDVTNDPWFSPAGLNRGQLKNLVRLAWNPTPAEQKVAFANDINNVLTLKGDGTYLFGDKTLLGYQSAFNQIGTRKMLNILKTTLTKAARNLLFEFNDEFTQARFKNLVEPYLRDVKGRRGLKDFRTVADHTNNTDFVVNSNRFVGDIYFVPARSIRTIQLNFIAVGSTVEFEEVA
jgi:phage tail sheath protein FI